MSKSELVKQVIAALKNDLDLAVQASSAAREAATDAQAKAEHKYDTRGLEQSYLADGQSRRASELIESIALLESIDNDDPTALIGLPLIRTARLLRQAGVKLL